MSAIDRLLAWNHANAGELPGGGEARPALEVTVLTCMDARISMARVIGIHPGDAHVLRNAGGLVTDDVVRSMVVSQVALGTREIMVIQHTRCGMIGLVDRQLAEQTARLRGRRPMFSFGGFQDLELQVRDSVRELRRNPYLVGEVRGFVFDVDTGLLHEVPVA